MVLRSEREGWQLSEKKDRQAARNGAQLLVDTAKAHIASLQSSVVEAKKMLARSKELLLRLPIIKK